MATYKVLQDIESEDKLFGPFTLKQFIFGAVTIVLAFIEFRILVVAMPIYIKLPFLLLFLPPIVLFGFLAAPLGRDQPNDVWLLARLRFLFKPRARIWNQDGVSELVTITAPKQDTHVYTNQISQTEVKSRLQALANTVDTRGWAVKNVNANLFMQPGYLTTNSNSDRLINPADLPQDVPATDITAADDILDPMANSVAQNLDAMMHQAASTQRQQAQALVSQATQPAPVAAQDFWQTDGNDASDTLPAPVPPNLATFSNQPVVAPGTDDAVKPAEASAEEEAFGHQLAEQHKQDNAFISDRMHVVQPLHDSEGNPVQAPAPGQSQPSVNPAVQALAGNNDWNVSTIANEAKRLNQKKDDGEVTISLR